MLVSSVIVLLTIGSTSISATNYARFNLLKDDRAAGRLVFIPTTLAQREVILSNVKNTLTVWVNYDSKIAHYKSAADPFPIVEKLRRNIKTITDKELQLGLTDAFIMARDHHTRWTNMAPYGCFYATTGVTFTFVEGDADIANKPTVVVISTSKHPVIRPLFGKDYSKIQAGDELLAINGLSFVEWFKQNQFTSGAGANDFGGQRAALKYLTTIYGKANRLPSDDSIKFQFKSRANPHTSYTVNVPYVSGHDEDCWNLGSKLYKSITSKTLPGTPETSLPVSAKQSGDNQESNTAHLSPKGRKMDNPKDSKREIAMGKISSSRQGSAILMSPTGVTKVTWGIYQPESTNMGIIKLNSFDPEDVGTTNLAVLKSVMVIRSLLVNELKDTKSVMFDLRGNSGGDTEFANNMVQLFKPDFQPFGHRYLMNKITFNLFVDGEDPNADIYAKAWKETEPNSRFTKVFFLNSVESVNTIGQAYVRPMGIFNDGRCYSSCEIFSGSIQGHGAGTIFGEDKQTGGGGAAVMELDPFLVTASPDDFQKFPFSQELTSGSTTHANTLSVGFIQAVRTGLYNGQTIEDAGITADTVFRPRWSDLQPNPTTNTQYDRIAERLARTGQKNGQSKLHFISEPFEIEKPIGKFSLEVEAAGIEKFTVFQADGETVIAKKKKWASTKKQRFSIPVSAAGSTLGNNRITIVGKTAGKQVLKTNRNVRTIPTNGNYMKISTLGFIFEGISNSVGLYQSSATAPADGWNNLKGPWMIGNGIKYGKDVDSSIEAFFTAPVGTEINVGINVALDTEPGHDFLYLSVKSSGGVEDFLLRSKSRDGTKTFDGISGRKRSVRKIIPFTTKSKRFSVSLRFTSDEVVEFAGATINSFTVSAA
ncbi:hypothetical protein BASA50_009411 [Batrachochytrium salamandrivorans]|uniref:Tail specific protease domain-containing protein n=1 Tax=Batrachochytrium salamandrivorans TaxID=1357716 RepID=A0ABQ8F220_9FUNG|nr:hypothetical protein BASA50_009411 [Batrachochytrium salamandrivorans]